jgi:hypothetical protein
MCSRSCRPGSGADMTCSCDVCSAARVLNCRSTQRRVDMAVTRRTFFRQAAGVSVGTAVGALTSLGTDDTEFACTCHLPQR